MARETRGVARAGFLGLLVQKSAGLKTRVGRLASGSTTCHHVLVRAPHKHLRAVPSGFEGTYNTKHAEAARLYYTTILRYYHIHTHTPTEH